VPEMDTDDMATSSVPEFVSITWSLLGFRTVIFPNGRLSGFTVN